MARILEQHPETALTGARRGRVPASALILAATAAWVLAAGPVRAQVPPLTTVRVASGLSTPLYVTAPPGDTARVFVVERRGSDARGRIKIVRNGAVLPTPFLTTGVLSSSNEQGLLGLAFAPDYAQTGRFYVDYTDAAGNTQIVRYQVSGDPNVANPNGTVILSIVQPYANHNGGWIGFGPDGYLYIAMGDGGDEGDPGDRAQDLNSLLGKILRIDVSGSGYTIPPGNPYAGATAGLDEIWCFGLRNPWRDSFDRQTHDFIIADVGQGSREEVDFLPAGTGAGANLGWRCLEGTLPYGSSTTTPCGSCSNPSCPFIAPATEYSHTGGKCSITGGYVYRGSKIPALQGSYFYADYCSRQIWSGTFQQGSLTNIVERTADLAPVGGVGVYSIGRVTSFGEDARGELYICDEDGEVFRIVTEDSVVGVGSGDAPARVQLRLTGRLPFYGQLSLEVDLPGPADASVDVFDVKGRKVRTLHRGVMPAGRTPLGWDGRFEGGAPAPSGVYWLRLRAAGVVSSARTVLLR
ncbi:MAG TPA: PQQ-dependent sugar dehydrogenase [Candidatus Eisenbacteria bacterium]|nr:PQQ-dependent sugar dehydrogenase [Candidatus Eisenbacteria bacterium]